MNLEKKQDENLIRLIHELTSQYPQYGYRKIYAIVRFRMGFKGYRNKIYDIMKAQKILLPASTRNKTLFRGVKISLNLDAVGAVMALSDAANRRPVKGMCLAPSI